MNAIKIEKLHTIKLSLNIKLKQNYINIFPSQFFFEPFSDSNYFLDIKKNLITQTYVDIKSENILCSKWKEKE